MKRILVWVVSLRAQSCRAVRGTVMVAPMREMDNERHDPDRVIRTAAGTQTAAERRSPARPKRPAVRISDSGRLEALSVRLDGKKEETSLTLRELDSHDEFRRYVAFVAEVHRDMQGMVPP